ncbi:MAG: glycosyl transferase [Dictyoglomus sp. NZ13-RE01]|nr:MAG: glycosyl transferase [Dictyoglomus sp. NZ13-RE01]
MSEKISIIIPTFNREKLLPRAIESVRRQTYKDWELLIVDDRSNDNTESLVKKYISLDDRIRYLKNERKKGPAGARNFGILNSKGEYIAFLDSDDEWSEVHLEECIDVLKNYDVNVCFALWIIVKGNGDFRKVFDPDIPEERARLERIISIFNPKVEGKYIFFGDNFYEESFLKGGSYCTHINTLVIKRDVIEKIGLFNEDLSVCEDSDFVYRVILHYPFCLIDNYHLYYYQSPDSIYNFFDRRDVNVDEVLDNREFIDKFTFVGLGQKKLNSIHGDIIKNSEKIVRKRECVNRIKDIIGRKYFTLGFMNQKVNRSKAILFVFKSLLYRFTWNRFLFLINLLFPFIPIKIDREKIKKDLSLW